MKAMNELSDNRTKKAGENAEKLCLLPMLGGVPFALYCTKSENLDPIYSAPMRDFRGKICGTGTITGAVRIKTDPFGLDPENRFRETAIKHSRLSEKELARYAKGRDLFFWATYFTASNLQVPLSSCFGDQEMKRPIKRPPQSWMWVWTAIDGKPTKAVLISCHAKWCLELMRGTKKLEVRLTCPKGVVIENE